MTISLLQYDRLQQGSLVETAGSQVGGFLQQLKNGDRIVPVFRQSEVAESVLSEHEQLCKELGLDSDALTGSYRRGRNLVMSVLTVNGSPVLGDDNETVTANLREDTFKRSIPLTEFLRFKSLDDFVAQQLPSTTPPRASHEVTRGLVDQVIKASERSETPDEFLRKQILVKDQSIEGATEILAEAGIQLSDSDQVFLATRAVISGRISVGADGRLLPGSPQALSQGPATIHQLLEDAQTKASARDGFEATPGLRACREIMEFVNSSDKFKLIDDYGLFMDMTNLSNLVTQAMSFKNRPVQSADRVAQPIQPKADADTIARLQGFTVEELETHLPKGFAVSRQVLASIVAALRAGKHILLGGPPGTGKTTIAEAICRAISQNNYIVTTATADWTTFDTIGGYLPSANSNGLKFQPGLVLRSLRDNSWLVIDEINRADIDKSFGPLFTVLSGDEESSERATTLPYSVDGEKLIKIKWSNDEAVDNSTYIVNPSWRIIGTLNISDKASLFQLSFAFLRRFAVIDIPLPETGIYSDLVRSWFAELHETNSIAVRFTTLLIEGPVELGPAILKDFSKIVIEGCRATAYGKASFDGLLEALVAATCLTVVPQYEGKPENLSIALLDSMSKEFPEISEMQRNMISRAFREVALQ